MSRPPLSPYPNGRRIALVAQALIWSASTRRLLQAEGIGEVWLAWIALYLCVRNAVLWIEGTATVPHEVVARVDCPLNPRELRRLRARLAGFRDEILHLPEKPGDDRDILTSRPGPYPPRVTLTSTVGRHTLRTDSMTGDEVIALLDELEPWLRRHKARMEREIRAGSV